MTKQFAALKSFNKSVTLPIFLFLMAWGMAFCTYGQNVGIGTTNPQASLDVNGSFRFTNGTQGNGRILRSDANGNAGWGKLQAGDMLDSAATAADFSCASIVGAVSTGTQTYPESVAISGNYAFVISSYTGKLIVLDISNPAAPVMVNAGVAVSVPNAIAISGNYAFICMNGPANGFLVFDISNPALPVQLPNGLPIKPFSIAIAGNYAYVRESATFHIVDISNPNAPVVNSSIAIASGGGGNMNSIAVAGSFAYVANGPGNNMQIINISNPAIPVITGSVGLNSPHSVAIAGNFAYVTGNPANKPGMVTVNISNPAAPVSVDTVATGLSPHLVSRAGTYLYVMPRNNNSMQVFDIRVADAPVLVKSIALAGIVRNLALLGNYAYAVSGNENLQIIRLACAQNLSLNASDGSVDKVPQHWERLDSNLVNLNPANIGIGVNNPLAKLHVNGTTRTTNFQMTAGAANGFLLMSDANGNASWVSAATISTAETDPKMGTLNSNSVPKWNGTTLADGLLFDNGTNIGIGTATPAQKLDVIGTTRTTTFQMTNGSASGFYLRSDAEGNATWAALPSTSPSGAAGGDLAGTYPNPTLALTGIAAGTYTKLQVDAKGRAIVGSNLSAADITPLETDPQIGTNTTNYLSKWNGTALVGSSVSESNGYMGIGLPANVFANAPLQVNSLYSGSGSTNWISASMGGANNANRVVMGMLNGDATIGGHSGTLSAWTDLIINPATVGNVGIGTDQPTAKLDVSGSVRLGNQGSVMDYIRSIEVIVSTAELGPYVALSWNINNFPLNLSPNAAVMANPKESLPLGIVIGWVRRTGTNTIRVQYQNTTNLSISMASHKLQVTAINFQ
jgi:hypothetical protein